MLKIVLCENFFFHWFAKKKKKENKDDERMFGTHNDIIFDSVKHFYPVEKR